MKFVCLVYSLIFSITIDSSEIRITNLKTFEDSTVNDFKIISKQIEETEGTTEPVPAAGSNLNVVGPLPPFPDEVHLGNFLSDKPTHQQFKNNRNKSKTSLPAVTIKSLSSFYSKEMKKRLINYDGNNEENKALALVLDNCLERKFIDNYNNKRFNGDKNTFNFTNDEFHNNDNESSVKIPLNLKREVNKNSTVLQILDLDKEISRSEERRQYQQDNSIMKTSALPSITTTTGKLTTETLKSSTDSFTAKISFSVTENVRKATYTEEAWFEAKDKNKIRFSKLPQRESYLIPTLKLEEGFYPFGFMSDFFTLIYPFDFPVGLIKDIVWGKFTFPYSFIKSVKVESTFLIFIIIFTCIGLIIPAYLICLGCMALLDRGKRDDLETGVFFQDEKSDCNEKYNILLMLFFLLLCVASIGGMTVSSQQAADAVEISQYTMQCSWSDISKWLVSSSRELMHSIVPPTEILLQIIRDDLRNVESLLGQPMQKAISSESGIDLVLESLNDIIEESEDLSNKISALRDITVRAGSLASIASDRLSDLSGQLDNIKKHCTGKDLPLCEIINTNSLKIQIQFNLILQEQQLLELRSLGVEKLPRAVTNAKQEFYALPSVIYLQTTSTREDILQEMETRREIITHSSRILSDMVRHLNMHLRTSSKRVEVALERLQSYDFWRWMAMTSCSVACGIVVLLIMFALISGNSSAKNCAKFTLQVSTIWMCISCLGLWALLSATFLIAGHAEVYVCQILWDKPQYRSLSTLLDRPSQLIENNEGVFDAMFRDLDNITIEVSIKDVLRECETDQPAYNVFKLSNMVDVNKKTSYFEWEKFHASLKGLSEVIDVSILKTVSGELNQILLQMTKVSDINIAQYRVKYNGPLVGKDLPSLVDQLENVAAQMTDLSTSGRLDTLASRTRRLHQTSIKPLEQLRSEIVFKLTELELQISPFRKKLNISLSHIHTAQYYINNQGDTIAQEKISEYSKRLISHVALWRTHVLTTTSVQAARCRPLYDVFDAIRTSLCTHYVASLHGWWICGFFLGSLWCFTAPLSVILWRQYGRNFEDEIITLSNIGSRQQESTPTTLCDTSNWNTPRPPPAPNDGW